MEVSSKLQSWSQAFEDHPILHTRTIEKQLQNDIAQNKQKLRNLVGGSYRELLATAEQIIMLDGKATNVEVQISELGRNCRPKTFVSTRDESSKHSNIAQLNLFQRCSVCIVSCLKTGQNILAAKLLAISRLLHTSLSKQEYPPKILETLLEQLSRSRHRLLRHIDRRLDDADIEHTELTDVICAFCLATSSSCNDAIRHFQHRRLGHIRHSAQGHHGNHRNTVKSFKYFVDSLRTTQALLGQEVPRALRRLQQTIILDDTEVIKLEHLNLGTLRVLIPAEIRNFTPYIKKSELSEHEATNLLKNWSAEAFAAIQAQLITHLKTLDNPSAAFALRKDLLSVWLATCFTIDAHTDLVPVLRKVFNQQIGLLLQSQVSSLSSIATNFIDSRGEAKSQSASQNLTTTSTSTALWSVGLVNTSISRSTAPLLSNIRTASLGSTTPLVTLSQDLSNWCSSVSDLQTSITDLQKIRWQDIIEDPDEVDEETTRSIVQQLSSDDTESYNTNLNSALETSLHEFQSGFATATRSTTAVNTALHLLRGIREVAIHLSASFPSTGLDDLRACIPHLHSIVADETVRLLAAEMKMAERSGVGGTLMRSPATYTLPSDLPSPPAFRTLRSLCKIMVRVGGTDTWTVAAVDVVKAKVGREIFSPRSDEGSKEDGVETGNTGDNKNQNQHQTNYICNAFDAAYLSAALDWKRDDGEGDPKIAAADTEDVEKAAVAYWERTRLLFGLLDP